MTTNKGRNEQGHMDELSLMSKSCKLLFKWKGLFPPEGSVHYASLHLWSQDLRMLQDQGCSE